MNRKLGHCLRQQRKKRNLTLRSVEEKTGISNAYLSQLENNKISRPSPSVLHKLADCYQVSYEFLMNLAGYPVPEANKKDIRIRLNRLGSMIDDLTPEEEEKLTEYLQFLRSIKKK
ncbi:MAG: helix-turn-helix transcriptional regulator [Candidatus Helarchaeota archaeon]|nr:helix-turn-helix transcriptional regulator [Candidatus Helarchaeota archaeon]